jgi:ABC-type lipoprotein release transport system permease subunit
LTKEESNELVFVVDVTSFTQRGFIGSSSFEGNRVDIEFDDGSDGVSLSSDMAKRIQVKVGSPLLIIGENEESPQTSRTSVTLIGEELRISDAKIYYFIGRYGGAIIRILRG